MTRPDDQPTSRDDQAHHRQALRDADTSPEWQPDAIEPEPDEPDQKP